MDTAFDLDQYLATGIAAKYAQELLTTEEAQLFEERLTHCPQLRNALLAEQLALAQRKMYSTSMPGEVIWNQVEQSLTGTENNFSHAPFSFTPKNLPPGYLTSHHAAAPAQKNGHARHYSAAFASL